MSVALRKSVDWGTLGPALGGAYECYAHISSFSLFHSQTHESVSETRGYQTPDSFTKLRARIVCQQPLADLYRFVGNLYVHQPDQHSQPVVRPLNPENVLLRGAMLKNTPFIFGKCSAKRKLFYRFF